MAYLAGDAEPLPWWLRYLIRAERWHCKPWDLYKGRKSREFWLEADDVLQDARYEVQRWQERQAEKASKTNARKSKRRRH